MTDDLHARLKRLEDAEAARSAIHVYCRGLDTYDLDVLRSSFADDVTVRGTLGAASPALTRP